MELGSEQGSDVGATLRFRDLSDLNWLVGHRKEGVQLALAACERLGDVVGQGWCLKHLASLLFEDDQLDAAEEAASRAIDLLPENNRHLLACESHHILGDLYRSKGDTEKAVHHFKVVLRIASSLNRQGQCFGLLTSWPSCFLGKADLTKRKLMLNKPSRARQIAH